VRLLATNVRLFVAVRKQTSKGCGWPRADLRPDYGKQQAAPQSVGWMMPP
jgi:hypothetical protein